MAGINTNFEISITTAVSAFIFVPKQGVDNQRTVDRYLAASMQTLNYLTIQHIKNVSFCYYDFANPSFEEKLDLLEQL